MNTQNLQHALLYSIDVKLPSHRVGQLDRVLVLASPVNDINLSAWDLNRVTRFIELDVGVRMDLCTSCARGQNTTITFILDRKQFIKDCIKFLCSEAKISDVPTDENGLLVYKIGHQCGFISPPTTRPPPPPYHEEDLANHGTDEDRNGTHKPLQISASSPEDSQPLEMSPSNSRNLRHTSSHAVRRDTKQTPRPLATTLKFSGQWGNFSDSEDTGSGSGTAMFSSMTPPPSMTASNIDGLPPRTIPRKNHEGAIPAVAHPYINFQPHLYYSGSGVFESPYQISSRIIISDSGEVQYERNVFGNVPQNHGGFQFKEKAIPPKGVQASSAQPPSARCYSSSAAATKGRNTQSRPTSNLITTSVRLSQTQANGASASISANHTTASSANANGRQSTAENHPHLARKPRHPRPSPLETLVNPFETSSNKADLKDKYSSVIHASEDGDNEYIIPTPRHHYANLPFHVADLQLNAGIHDGEASGGDVSVKVSSQTLPSSNPRERTLSMDAYIVMNRAGHVSNESLRVPPAIPQRKKRPRVPRKSLGSSGSNSSPKKRTQSESSPQDIAASPPILVRTDEPFASGFQLQTSGSFNPSAGSQSDEEDAVYVNNDVFLCSEEGRASSNSIQPLQVKPVSPRRPVPKPRNIRRKKSPTFQAPLTPNLKAPSVAEKMFRSTSDGDITELANNNCCGPPKRSKSTTSVLEADA